MKKILIAEDESAIANFLAINLQANGFLTSIAKNGYEAIEMIENEQFDLLLLDLNLPERDGVEIIKHLRASNQKIAIIILTARDKVRDIETENYDYILKPFSLEELLPRIDLRLQEPFRVEPTQEKSLKVGNLSLDLPRRTVQISDRTIRLSNQEFILLDILMRHPNQILTQEYLHSYLWGDKYDPNSNILDLYVGSLDQKLGSGLLETVRNKGYRLRI